MVRQRTFLTFLTLFLITGNLFSLDSSTTYDDIIGISNLDLGTAEYCINTTEETNTTNEINTIEVTGSEDDLDLDAVNFDYDFGTGPEICDNGIDDDGDGKVDGLDPDCGCFDASSYATLDFRNDIQVVSGGLNLSTIYRKVGTWQGTNFDLRVTLIGETHPNEIYDFESTLKPGTLGYVGNRWKIVFTTKKGVVPAGARATVKFDLFVTGTNTPIAAPISMLFMDLDGPDGEVRFRESDIYGHEIPAISNLTKRIEGNELVFKGTSSGSELYLRDFRVITNAVSTFTMTFVKEFSNSNIVLTGMEVIPNAECFQPEVCGDGIDNDRNGFVDCADSECGKPTITSANGTSPSNCPTLNNGSITINATGANLQYSINGGSTYQSNRVFSNLSAGTFNIRVRNSASGCTVNHTSTIKLVDISCPEVCNNGIDDDRDGKIDCTDSNCGKPTITSVRWHKI